MDKNHCWTALKYSKSLQFRTILALKDGDGDMAVSMKAKKALVQKSAFSKLPTNLIEPPVMFFGSAHMKINEKVVGQALLTQAATKAPSLDKINFQILQIIWCWDKVRITSMVYYAI